MSSESTDNKTVDHLEGDAPVPGQNFVCLSFVSPEKVIKQKEAFMLQEFWSYLREQSTSDEPRFDLSIMENIEDAYSSFVYDRSADLEQKFHSENAFQTSIRGLKVRGVYNTMEEATIRSKVLQRLDRSHHVFVAPVGYWVPWDPNADGIQDQVYQEDQLNELMKNYKENEAKRDMHYENEKTRMKDEAIKENLKRAAANDDEDDEESAPKQTVEEVATALENAKDHASLAEEFENFKQKKA